MSKQTVTPSLSAKELENCFRLACDLQEQGELWKAIKAYQDLLNLFPNIPQLNFNCGLAFFALQQYMEAEIHYSKACDFAPDDPDIHYNRGLNFRRLGKIREAANSFEHAFQSGDHALDTLYSLALCYQDLAEFPQAAALYESILVSYPEHSSTLNNYAYLCHKSGNMEKAEELYRRLLILNPAHQAARHMLDSLSGNTPDTAPLEYVEAVFDNYAKTFEQSLVEELSYKTPKSIWQRYVSLFPRKQRELCIDLGCGTGLAGEQFSPYCNRLIGVDISEEMLHLAKRKDIYHDLIKSDIDHFINQTDLSPDLIVAADVFTYMGNLESLFEKCYLKAQAEGLFLFSVEDTASNSFALKDTGRFGHSPEYIQDICRRTGWRVLDQQSAELRQENGMWIKGHLFILQKE